MADLPTGISRSRDIQGKEAKFLGSIFARWDGAVEIYHLNSDEFDSNFADLPGLSFKRSGFNYLALFSTVRDQNAL